jgi:hypothetical protein
VSSRRNLSYPSRRSSPNPRPINRLQPLFPYSVAPVLCFQQLAASFPKSPGVGVPLREGRCTEAQKCPSVSPLPATLTHSVSRKSFACHSYANTRDRGVTPPPKFFSPLATRHSPLALTPFRMNTCKSVSKQSTLTIFRMNTYKKQGEGGPSCEGQNVCRGRADMLGFALQKHHVPRKFQRCSRPLVRAPQEVPRRGRLASTPATGRGKGRISSALGMTRLANSGAGTAAQKERPTP